MFKTGHGTNRNQDSGSGLRMSALGQKRTLKRVCPMSALPPKADIDRSRFHSDWRAIYIYQICQPSTPPWFVAGAFARDGNAGAPQHCTHHAWSATLGTGKLP